MKKSDYDRHLIRWIKNHYWDSLEKDKDLLLRHMKTFADVEYSDTSVLDEIANEVKSAQQKYHPFNSNHEGYAVLLEEVDELWDEIKESKDIKATAGMKKECIQIAAMAVRFIEDLC